MKFLLTTDGGLSGNMTADAVEIEILKNDLADSYNLGHVTIEDIVKAAVKKVTGYEGEIVFSATESKRAIYALSPTIGAELKFHVTVICLNGEFQTFPYATPVEMNRATKLVHLDKPEDVASETEYKDYLQIHEFFRQLTPDAKLMATTNFYKETGVLDDEEGKSEHNRIVAKFMKTVRA